MRASLPAVLEEGVVVDGGLGMDFWKARNAPFRAAF